MLCTKDRVIRASSVTGMCEADIDECWKVNL